MNKPWRTALEESFVYLGIITPDFFNDILAIEQALYAKALKKPAFLIIVKNTPIEIPDLFPNVVGKVYIQSAKDLDDPKITDKIATTLKKLQEEYRK